MRGTLFAQPPVVGRLVRAPEVDEAPDESVVLLREIRDALNRPV